MCLASELWIAPQMWLGMESAADEARRDRPAGIQTSTRCAPGVAKQSVPREPFTAGAGLTGASDSARDSALVAPIPIYNLARMRAVGVVALQHQLFLISCDLDARVAHFRDQFATRRPIR